MQGLLDKTNYLAESLKFIIYKQIFYFTIDIGIGLKKWENFLKNRTFV